LKLLLCTLGLEILNSRFGFLIILSCFELHRITSLSVFP
jgi:hypothetical protein